MSEGFFTRTEDAAAWAGQAGSSRHSPQERRRTLGPPGAQVPAGEGQYVSLDDRIDAAAELCRSLEAELDDARVARQLAAGPDLHVIEGSDMSLPAVRNRQAYVDELNARAAEDAAEAALTQARAARDALLQRFYAANVSVGEKRRSGEMYSQARSELPWAAGPEDQEQDARRRTERSTFDETGYYYR